LNVHLIREVTVQIGQLVVGQTDGAVERGKFEQRAGHELDDFEAVIGLGDRFASHNDAIVLEQDGRGLARLTAKE